MDITSSISSLSQDYASKITDALKSATTTDTTDTTESSSFDSIYDSVSGLLDSTNTAIQTAQQAEVDYALGNTTNTHELSVAQEEANVALQYTVAVRDKALDAYKEIMNMSI